MFKLVLLAAVAAPALFAQNSVTVTASRGFSSQADLVVIAVDVLTGLDASRDDILAAVQSPLITVDRLSNIRTVQQYQSDGNQTVTYLDWTFAVTAPIGNFKTMISQLTALQQAVAQKKNGMSLSISVQGTQSSPQVAQGLTCSIPGLMADARAQAQKLATAAGASVGSVLSMSGGAPPCFLTVKFALSGGL